MCGPHSAIGLAEAERELWPQVRERLREPGSLMGLMRGVLGGAVEVAAVVATTPDGVVRPVALLATPALTEEIRLSEAGGVGVRPARIGEDEIDVLVASPSGQDRPEPLAILVTPWMVQNLALYARNLWSRQGPSWAEPQEDDPQEWGGRPRRPTIQLLDEVPICCTTGES